LARTIDTSPVSAGRRQIDAGVHHGDFEQLRRRERRQDGWKPRRPDHEKIVAAGGGHFERALGAFLALDIG
jgi:hypothetical protein